jgi:hypothetical protein
MSRPSPPGLSRIQPCRQAQRRQAPTRWHVDPTEPVQALHNDALSAGNVDDRAEESMLRIRAISMLAQTRRPEASPSSPRIFANLRGGELKFHQIAGLKLGDALCLGGLDHPFYAIKLPHQNIAGVETVDDAGEILFSMLYAKPSIYLP